MANKRQLVKVVFGSQPRLLPELIQFGFPLPKGESLQQPIELVDELGTPLLAKVTPVAYWPDQSVRWCLANVAIPADARGEVALYLADKQSKRHRENRPVLVEKNGAKLEFRSQNFSYQLNCEQLTSLAVTEQTGRVFCKAEQVLLRAADGSPLNSRVDRTCHKVDYSGSEPLLVEIKQFGVFLNEEGKETVAKFEYQLKCHYQANKVEVAFTLHNPKAAEHLNGAWDLGDRHSLYFTECSFGWTLPSVSGAHCLNLEDGVALFEGEPPFLLYQEASGGKQWNSPTHLDHQASIPMTQPGYRVESVQGCSSGDRAQPLLHLTSEHSRAAFWMKDFWQNCPSSLSVSAEQLRVSLFPAEFPTDHELQPGERKTHTFVLAFGDTTNESPLVSPPPQLIWNPDWLTDCQALPWLTANDQRDRLLALIRKGLFGEESLLAKRESVDEYGWRHFGELYADHEAAGYEGEGLFISHYNNQYDPIYGLYRQGLMNGSPEVFEQGQQLSRHVIDIDIYHTLLDKDEYNLGLFWHTDHYQKAQTCTHRTYSTLHQSGVYEDHAGGGGPGGQHCYTTGLLIDFWLTGNEHAKQAVLGLARWITLLYEGKGTFIELLLSWKNRSRKDLKNFFTGRYPLDRGIGNYIVALLDAHAITHQSTYLNQVAHIIHETVHPCDEINEREFEDVEETWFYTVFFQAVGRFLLVKLERQELDEDFCFARDSLSHYANWMAEHEALSLSHPERLEFPNLTWTAQDLRKVNVLYLASYFDDANRARFATKAEHLYEQVLSSLEADSTHTHTRILAILMQNHGVREWVRAQPEQEFPKQGQYQKIPYHSKLYQIRRLLSLFASTCLNFSPSKELDQLRRRFPKFIQLIGPVHERD